MKKLTHEDVKNYYANEKYIINSIYNGANNKDKLICPIGHEIELTYSKFKNDGVRCRICFINNRKNTNEYIFNYYKQNNYILNSIYKGSKYKDKLTCPLGHDIEMTFNDFQSGKRCKKCYLEFNKGINHPNYNSNREELLLNKRLRIRSFAYNWVVKNMKDDPNYKDYLIHPKKYVIDHIIPIKLFCELFIIYKLDEQKVKDIINQRDNLQLLTRKENSDKKSKGSSLFESINYLINNGIPFEKFLEENKRGD